jgi:hypothetical protein
MTEPMHVGPKRIASLCLVLMSALIISACAPEATAPPMATDTSITELSIDTKGEMIDIRSDNVSMAGYDASTQRMTVMFDNGKSYWYQPVDQSVWTAFYNAQPHPWSQVGYPALVEAGVPYGKIN